MNHLNQEKEIESALETLRPFLRQPIPEEFQPKRFQGEDEEEEGEEHYDMSKFSKSSLEKGKRTGGHSNFEKNKKKRAYFPSIVFAGSGEMKGRLLGFYNSKKRKREEEEGKMTALHLTTEAAAFEDNPKGKKKLTVTKLESKKRILGQLRFYVPAEAIFSVYGRSFRIILYDFFYANGLLRFLIIYGQSVYDGVAFGEDMKHIVYSDVASATLNGRKSAYYNNKEDENTGGGGKLGSDHLTGDIFDNFYVFLRGYPEDPKLKQLVQFSTRYVRLSDLISPGTRRIGPSVRGLGGKSDGGGAGRREKIYPMREIPESFHKIVSSSTSAAAAAVPSRNFYQEIPPELADKAYSIPSLFGFVNPQTCKERNCPCFFGTPPSEKAEKEEDLYSKRLPKEGSEKLKKFLKPFLDYIKNYRAVPPPAFHKFTAVCNKKKDGKKNNSKKNLLQKSLFSYVGGEKRTK